MLLFQSYFGHLSHGDTYYLKKNILEHLVLSKQTEKERKDEDERMLQDKGDKVIFTPADSGHGRNSSAVELAGKPGADTA